MGVGSGILQGLKDIVGANQKAILEIADFSEKNVKREQAAQPGAGNGARANPTMKMSDTGFDTNALKSYANASGSSVAGKSEQEFLDYKNFRKYRFECQFNPEQISITGYGGEQMAIQNYRTQDHQRNAGSLMAVAKTRIDFRVRLVFDKTNIQDAFYYDKFSLSATGIGKGIGTAVMKAKGKSYSVQPEVEALTAIVRDDAKRLARFVWGDMIYEGVLNTVSAEYVMFNVNCEPIRAYVDINMALYDESVAGANSERWLKEYMKDIYSLKSNAIVNQVQQEIADEAADNAGLADMGEALNNLFG